MDFLKQSFNPYLPSYEYIPDGETYVFGDRVYVYGSHDRFNGTQFCMNDYVCWSVSADDLSTWKYEGVIYKKTDDPEGTEESILLAPDVERGPDGRFYLYYTLGISPVLSAAVSDYPTGPFHFYGRVRRKDGTVAGTGEHDVFQFDPGVFRDDDGKIYLYSGFAPDEEKEFADAVAKYQMEGAYVAELEEDMLTMKTEQKLIVPKIRQSAGTGFEGHEFFEASSMRKIKGKYYFIYSSILSHELCYAVSDRPDGGFSYGGTLVSIGDIGYHGRSEPDNYLGNTHGSLACIKGQWYVFYHRQTNRQNYSRQACAEKIYINEDGSIDQTEITSCGLNDGPLSGTGTYEARIACNLESKDGALTYGHLTTPEVEEHPYFTQSGEDREGCPDQYIANMKDGAKCGFKYFALTRPREIFVEVLLQYLDTGVLLTQETGVLELTLDEEKECICRIPLRFSAKNRKESFKADILKNVEGTHAIYFTYKGTGSVNFHTFTIQ